MVLRTELRFLGLNAPNRDICRPAAKIGEFDSMSSVIERPLISAHADVLLMSPNSAPSRQRPRSNGRWVLGAEGLSQSKRSLTRGRAGTLLPCNSAIARNLGAGRLLADLARGPCSRTLLDAKRRRSAGRRSRDGQARVREKGEGRRRAAPLRHGSRARALRHRLRPPVGLSGSRLGPE
jgi:hypothetical protein